VGFRWQTLHFSELGGDELYTIMRLRQQVFIVEQDCVYLDLDDLDQESLHMLCWRGEELLAYQRCLPPGLSFAESAIGRIVVAPNGRGLKLGRELVQRGIDNNHQRWPEHDIQIGAQAHLENFYASLGFVTEGKEYIEDGIPHIHMIRSRVEK